MFFRLPKIHKDGVPLKYTKKMFFYLLLDYINQWYYIATSQTESRIKIEMVFELLQTE